MKIHQKSYLFCNAKNVRLLLTTNIYHSVHNDLVL